MGESGTVLELPVLFAVADGDGGGNVVGRVVYVVGEVVVEVKKGLDVVPEVSEGLGRWNCAGTGGIGIG